MNCRLYVRAVTPKRNTLHQIGLLISFFCFYQDEVCKKENKEKEMFKTKKDYILTIKNRVQLVINIYLSISYYVMLSMFIL